MPASKKHTLNSIFQLKNISKIIEVDTSISNSNNINIQNDTSKSLDNYFEITEKPASPIEDIIYSKEEEINQNTVFTLSEIKHRIDELYETEMVEIFKIIKDNKEKYTTNNNGIFINISNLKAITITEITKFLIFSEKNNKLLDKEEEERDLYREFIYEGTKYECEGEGTQVPSSNPLFRIKN
jgi:hypothetical protein